MDFGIVAAGANVDAEGNPTHVRKLKALLDLLNVTRPNVASVGDLVNFVNTDPSAAVPIGDLYIGAHSTGDGTVEIQMTSQQKHEADDKSRFLSDYETIQDTQDPDPKVNIGPIVIDDSTVGPDPATHSVHFKGCNLGKAVPLLQQWKLAFGNKIQLSAPKYTHGLAADNAMQGLWEYLQYEFVVTSTQPVSNRAALIQLFQFANMRFLEVLNNGTLAPGPVVDLGNWDGWLPRVLDMQTVFDPEKKQFVPAVAPQKQPRWHYFDVQPLAAPRGTIPINEQFTADVQPFPRPILYPAGTPLPTDPKQQMLDLTDNLLLDHVNTDLGRISRFVPDHPFPVYERWGYEDLPSFLAGFQWTFKPDKHNPRQLNARGTRQRYTILVAVTDPNPGVITTLSGVLTNFHPLNSVLIPGTQLPLDDPRFFKIV